MTNFDSNPYTQGNMRMKQGTADKFVMNYRLLKPVNYNANYSSGYPLILILHGAVERANCYYNSCYHANWSYDPNVNNPKAPTSSSHKLLNNDHNLQQGGKVHLDARNLAGAKLPNDPTLAARAFPGFVLVPQMFNVWDSLNVQDAIRLVQLVQKQYKIDPNRIYVHGLSIGGFATYQAIKRAHWLFAAALPISAVHDANIIKQRLQPKVAPIPMWVFQGGKDSKPSPTYTSSIVNNLRSAGAIVNYTVYSDVGHTCWHKAFAEPKFFSWILSQNKANITPAKGITVINTSKAIYPKLMLPEGFFVYQWERNGAIISGATSNMYVANVAGTYRARFSRVSNPTSTQWNRWSNPVKITTATAGARVASVTDSTATIQIEEPESEFNVVAYPNPAWADNVAITITTTDVDAPVSIEIFDPTGKSVFQKTESAATVAAGLKPAFQRNFPDGVYVVTARQGRRTVRTKLLLLR